ncbi:MAG: hypothetical protein AAFU38_08915 [Bacteroidota bacterium]
MKTTPQTRTPSTAALSLRGGIASRAVLSVHAHRTTNWPPPCWADTRS